MRHSKRSNANQIPTWGYIDSTVGVSYVMRRQLFSVGAYHEREMDRLFIGYYLLTWKNMNLLGQKNEAKILIKTYKFLMKFAISKNMVQINSKNVAFPFNCLAWKIVQKRSHYNGSKLWKHSTRCKTIFGGSKSIMKETFFWKGFCCLQKWTRNSMLL